MRVSLMQNVSYQESELPLLDEPGAETRPESRYKHIEVTALEIAKITLVVMQMLTELVRLAVAFLENLEKSEGSRVLNVPSVSFSFPVAAPQLMPVPRHAALPYVPQAGELLQIEGA